MFTNVDRIAFDELFNVCYKSCPILASDFNRHQTFTEVLISP